MNFLRSPTGLTRTFWIIFLSSLFAGAELLFPFRCPAAGVTLVTHGYDSSYPTWVTAMADQIPNYSRFPGTNFSTYKLTLTYSSGAYHFTFNRTNGAPPAATDSGEIIIELDWSQLSGDLFDSYASTYGVGLALSQVLMLTNAIAELNGHALVELPVHLIGHSRGGSLVSWVSYILGTNGLWVDHLTTLDPYPINNDGNSDLVPVVDASAKNAYENVLFCDDIWQDLGTGALLGDPIGEAVSGAYVRQLYSLPGGYANVTSSSVYHSDVHLWYHGTVTSNTPTSDGTATIGTAERTNWWVSYENEGLAAGFYYSLIGGGNRLSTAQPLGPGYPAIVDGYNQNWDLGAGAAGNRTLLPSNEGTWPNIIKFDVTGMYVVAAGKLLDSALYYQYAGKSNLTVQIGYDTDFNPYNTNSTVFFQTTVPGTGATTVNVYSNLTLATTNVAPGIYAVYARISDGIHTRYLYAPELVQIISTQAPILDIAQISSTQFRIGVSAAAGQTIILQTSTDLSNWTALVTNTLSANRENYTNTPPASPGQRFYRAVLSQ